MNKKIQLITDTETLVFPRLLDVAKHLGINEGTKKAINKKCEQLEYDIIYPINKNDLPLP